MFSAVDGIEADVISGNPPRPFSSSLARDLRLTLSPNDEDSVVEATRAGGDIVVLEDAGRSVVPSTGTEGRVVFLRIPVTVFRGWLPMGVFGLASGVLLSLLRILVVLEVIAGLS